MYPVHMDGLKLLKLKRDNYTGMKYHGVKSI